MNAYVNGNVTNLSDPFGLSAYSWLAGFGYSGEAADAFDAELGAPFIAGYDAVNQGVEEKGIPGFIGHVAKEGYKQGLTPTQGRHGQRSGSKKQTSTGV